MAITRLKRKHRKNIARANNKQRVIKQLLATPVIKNVDIEELKAQFGKNPVSSSNAGTSATEAVTNTAATNSNTISQTFTNAFSAVTDKVGDIVDSVKDKVEDVVEAVKDKVEDVTGSNQDKAAE